MLKKYLLTVLIFSLIVIGYLFIKQFLITGRNNHSDNNYEYTTTIIDNKDYRLKVADTPEKLEKGLMFVKTKPKDYDGMVFIFSDKQIRTFWNKNTYLPLKLYWFDDQKLVGTSNLDSITKTKTITTVTSPDKVNFVIEIFK